MPRKKYKSPENLDLEKTIVELGGTPSSQSKDKDDRTPQQRYNEANPDKLAKAHDNFRANYSRITLNLHREADEDIIEWLKDKEKQETIKAALRAMMRRSDNPEK